MQLEYNSVSSWCLWARLQCNQVFTEEAIGSFVNVLDALELRGCSIAPAIVVMRSIEMIYGISLSSTASVCLVMYWIQNGPYACGTVIFTC